VGTVPTGAAHDGQRCCRTPVARMAATIAGIPVDATSGVGVRVRAKAGEHGIGSGERRLQRRRIGRAQVSG